MCEDIITIISTNSHSTDFSKNVIEIDSISAFKRFTGEICKCGNGWQNCEQTEEEMFCFHNISFLNRVTLSSDSEMRSIV